MVSEGVRRGFKRKVWSPDSVGHLSARRGQVCPWEIQRLGKGELSHESYSEAIREFIRPTDLIFMLFSF